MAAVRTQVLNLQAQRATNIPTNTSTHTEHCSVCLSFNHQAWKAIYEVTLVSARVDNTSLEDSYLPSKLCDQFQPAVQPGWLFTVLTHSPNKMACLQWVNRWHISDLYATGSIAHERAPSRLIMNSSESQTEQYCIFAMLCNLFSSVVSRNAL